jgi:shikimate kinase
LETAKMNVILIGYRATGKSSVARILGGHLGWPWVDADVEIEGRAGKSIARIFAEDGEPAFRDLESQVIADLCSQSQWIIAAGGGAPMREQNRQAMKQSGKVIWLQASPQTIYHRMYSDPTTKDRRPNLTDRGGLEEIIELLQKREPVYRQTADYVVDTDGKTVEDVAAEVLAYLKPFLPGA